MTDVCNWNKSKLVKRSTMILKLFQEAHLKKIDCIAEKISKFKLRKFYTLQAYMISLISDENLFFLRSKIKTIDNSSENTLLGIPYQLIF